jgi:hypothetical protein
MPYPGYEIQPPARQAYASESERPCSVPHEVPEGPQRWCSGSLAETKTLMLS